MSKLPEKTNVLLLRFFTKPYLVEILLITFDTYKIDLVHMLLFPFFKICSSMENFHIEVELLRSIFKCNNYPVYIIDQCIKKFLDKLYIPKRVVSTVPKKELLVVHPYLGTFSLNLRKQLYKSVTKSLSQCNLKVIFQSKVRAGEHISTSPLTGKRVNNNKNLSGHMCSFEDFTVLNYESHKFKQLITESLLVTKDKPLLNKQVKSLKLELFSFNSAYAILLYLR